MHLLWKRLEPVVSDVGLVVTPTTTLADCPPLDVLCVPGGPGRIDLMDDEEVLKFVRQQGQEAHYVTSICTGALVLGAAGLLRGYRATTHWASMDNLPLFGATRDDSRDCVSRNRVTDGGITAGIDFGLYVASLLTDRATAERIQLFLEYAPEPPFEAGRPDTTPGVVRAALGEAIRPMLERRRAAYERAARRLGVV